MAYGWAAIFSTAFFWFPAFETSEHYVIAMEYLPGGELFDYVLERDGLSEQAAKEIFRQLAQAVQHCHNVNIHKFWLFC